MFGDYQNFAAVSCNFPDMAKLSEHDKHFLTQEFRIEEIKDAVLPIGRLNHGIITLLPKSIDASSIQKYKPICLLNVNQFACLM